MDSIKIIDVKQELWSFQKVTVHYVFDEAFVGEMDFRFKRWTPAYHAKMFVHELERATQTIEILQSLNYMEVFMSLNDQF